MGILPDLPSEASTVVLVGSLLSAPAAWVGGRELLTASGFSQWTAALLASVYVLARAGYSVRQLRRRVPSHWFTDPVLPGPSRSVVHAANDALDGTVGTPTRPRPTPTFAV